MHLVRRPLVQRQHERVTDDARSGKRGPQLVLVAAPAQAGAHRVGMLRADGTPARSRPGTARRLPSSRVVLRRRAAAPAPEIPARRARRAVVLHPRDLLPPGIPRERIAARRQREDRHERVQVEHGHEHRRERDAASQPPPIARRGGQAASNATPGTYDGAGQFGSTGGASRCRRRTPSSPPPRRRARSARRRPDGAACATRHAP